MRLDRLVVQAHDCGVNSALGGRLGQRLVAPKTERLGQQSNPLGWIVRLRRLIQDPLEDVYIDRDKIRAKAVATSGGLDDGATPLGDGIGASTSAKTWGTSP